MKGIDTMWRSAATVILDASGAYLDADERALDLLGVETADQLRAMPPDAFAAVPPDPEEQAAWRKAYFGAAAQGVLAEGTFRRTDGELVRVRTAILPESDGRYRALFFPIERPTSNLSARVYTIADVLREWRAAERELVDLDPASPGAQAVADQVALLREQYQTLFRRSRGSV